MRCKSEGAKQLVPAPVHKRHETSQVAGPPSCIDNLASCFCALEALVTATGLEEDPQCRVVALFDNEEVCRFCVLENVKPQGIVNKAMFTEACNSMV